MLSKTYALSLVDQEKLMALVTRCTSVRTFVDEKNEILYVLTSSGTTESPCRPALRLKLSVANARALQVEAGN